MASGVVAVATSGWPDTSYPPRSAPVRERPSASAGSVTSRTYRSVVNPWQTNPSATSPATGHDLTDPGQQHRWWSVGIGTGVEEWGHKRVRIEVSAEIELAAGVPAI